MSTEIIVLYYKHCGVKATLQIIEIVMDVGPLTAQEILTKAVNS